MWFILLLCLLISPIHADPVDYDSFYNPVYSSPEGGNFGFAGLSFYPGGSSLLTQDFEGSFGGTGEEENVPLYTDGEASEPQATITNLQKQYSKQVRKAPAHIYRANYPHGTIGSGPTIASASSNLPIRQQPSYRYEPVPSITPKKEERRPKYREVFEATPNQGRSQAPIVSVNSGGIGQLSRGASINYGAVGQPTFVASQPLIQTGFIPILNGAAGQGKRSQSPISSVLKEAEPPILTADSIQEKPTLFKVSASVLSNSKVSPSLNQSPSKTVEKTHSAVVDNSTAESQLRDSKDKQRDARYSRFVKHRNDTQILAVSSSASESIVSRVISNPETTPGRDARQKNVLKSRPNVPEDKESRIAAKKTLDINCEGSKDLGWCELGDKYPRKYVKQVVDVCPEVIQRMHVEVPHSFEKLSDTSDFKSALDNSSGSEARERGSHDAWSWAAYFQEGSLCDSETGFLRPETAKDTTGKWNIIVQTEEIKQRIPIEMCRKVNNSCKKMLECGLKSQCLQKYNYHMLLSLNPTQKHDCPFMKLYRFPSACVCHVE